jgi:hypothetical protein
VVKLYRSGVKCIQLCFSSVSVSSKLDTLFDVLHSSRKNNVTSKKNPLASQPSTDPLQAALATANTAPGL